LLPVQFTAGVHASSCGAHWYVAGWYVWVQPPLPSHVEAMSQTSAEHGELVPEHTPL
jgi:hypothetical protein